jgi:hypothetical protein
MKECELQGGYRHALTVDMRALLQAPNVIEVNPEATADRLSNVPRKKSVNPL